MKPGPFGFKTALCSAHGVPVRTGVEICKGMSVLLHPEIEKYNICYR